MRKYNEVQLKESFLRMTKVRRFRFERERIKFIHLCIKHITKF